MQIGTHYYKVNCVEYPKSNKLITKILKDPLYLAVTNKSLGFSVERPHKTKHKLIKVHLNFDQIMEINCISDNILKVIYDTGHQTFIFETKFAIDICQIVQDYVCIKEHGQITITKQRVELQISDECLWDYEGMEIIEAFKIVNSELKTRISDMTLKDAISLMIR